MTYIEYDESVQSGDPINLFLFTRNGVDYRFTDGPLSVVALSETWIAAPISTSAIRQSEDMGRDNIELEFPRDNSFAKTFLSDLIEFPTSVTFYRGYVADPDQEFIVYWKGRISGSTSAGNIIQLTCEPIFTSLRRPGLRARYQRSCRHALYGRGCNVDKDAFKVDADCTAAAGNIITVPDAAASPAGYFIGGMVQDSNGVYRFITNHSGSILTLIRPLESLIEDANSSAGVAAVSLYPGCDHTRTTCENKFNNQLNYGGFPWIPTKNPFGGSSIV